MRLSLNVVLKPEALRAARLASGDNVAEDAAVSVDIAQLSKDVRDLLLDANSGTFPGFLRGFAVTADDRLYCAHASTRFYVSSTDLSPSDIDQLIRDGAEAARLAHLNLRQEAAVRAAESEVARAKARAEYEANQKRLQDARELLADELQELARCREANSVLSSFLSNIPDDVLKDTLVSLAKEDRAKRMEEIKVEVERAAAGFTIFGF